MAHGILDCGLAVAAKESFVKCHLHDPASTGKGFHLLVSEVARMVAEGAATGMTAYDGHFAQFQSIPETRFRSMAQVHHHAHAVHLLHDFTPERAQSAVLLIATGRVADVVISIVAERHIDDSALTELPDEREVAPDSISVLNAHHQSFLSFGLQAVKVFWRACNPNGLWIAVGQPLDIVEQLLCLCGYALTGLLVAFALRQVSHHDARIEVSFGHLMQIDKNLWVTGVEVDAFVGKHRGIAMAVEREDALVQSYGLAIRISLIDQPCEQGRHGMVVVLAQDEAFGMPLHAQNTLLLRAFNGFDDPIRGGGGNAQMRPRFTDCLMVERIDGKAFRLHDAVEQAVSLNLYVVRSIFAWKVLVVFDELLARKPFGNILIYLAV